jgi:glycosyltransferase involved in cell wall biosynthesis
MDEMPAKKICIVVSSPSTVEAFMIDQIKALERYHKVWVIANSDNTSFLKERGVNAAIISVPIEREISLVSDISSILSLIKIFRELKYDLVHSVTPKAGLLCMIAGSLAGIRVRVHTFTGQIWATLYGRKRWLLKGADRLISFLSTNILVDSRSQRSFLLAEGVVKKEKSYVLANGSISGVDVDRFKPDRTVKQEVRMRYGISYKDVVFLYMGRLKGDKGLMELSEAFARLQKKHANVHLMVVGRDEEGMKPLIRNICGISSCRLHLVEETGTPQHYMAAADVLCLPSHREGFGSVIIEAAAVGIPSIGTDIYGISDAIVSDVTGVLFPVGNADALFQKMELMLTDDQLRMAMGEKARKRARLKFDKEIVTSALLVYYQGLLSRCDSKDRCHVS